MTFLREKSVKKSFSFVKSLYFKSFYILLHVKWTFRIFIINKTNYEKTFNGTGSGQRFCSRNGTR